MKHHVKLSYRSNGLQPPVYAVTSLSDPEWEPVEMHSRVLDDSELEFWHDFEASEGEHQYKFRLGPGDWWVLDESKPSVDDGFGNRNNVIVVEAPVHTHKHAHKHEDSIQPLELTSAAPAPEQKPATPLGITIKPEHTKHALNPVRLSPTDPMTPPMTPEISNDSLADAAKFQPFPAPAADISRPGSAASHYSDKSVEEGVANEPKDEHLDVVDTPSEQQRTTSLLDAVRYFFITIGTWLINAFGGGARLTGAVAIFVGLAAMAYKVRDARSAIMPSIISMLYPSRNGTDASIV